MQSLKKLLFVALIFCFASISVGCNTISGIGEDMQAAGAAIQNKAEDVKDDDE